MSRSTTRAGKNRLLPYFTETSTTLFPAGNRSTSATQNRSTGFGVATIGEEAAVFIATRPPVRSQHTAGLPEEEVNLDARPPTLTLCPTTILHLALHVALGGRVNEAATEFGRRHHGSVGHEEAFRYDG